MKKKIFAENRLTDTLRHVVHLLMYLEVPILAIRFQFKGQTWEADTAEEAIALRAKLEESFHADPFAELLIEDKFWTADKFTAAIENIGAQQQRLLATVYRFAGITSDQLKNALQLDSELALAGVISGLSKQLKQVDIEPKQVFQINVSWRGKKKTRMFQLNPDFVQVAYQLDWPEAWEKKTGKQDAHSD